MQPQEKNVIVLLESDFYEKEIFYYQHRFAEANINLHFMTRLWGNNSIEFKGHDYHIPMSCNESFEDICADKLNNYSAVIVPSGMVADRLRYTEDINKIPPATKFLSLAFSNKNIIKGIICHGLWLCAPMTGLIKGRRLTVHNNLLGDAKAYGAVYVDQDLVIDDDLVTARTGDHCHLLASTIIKMIKAQCC